MLSDEETSCINQCLSGENENPLCPPFQVIMYQKVVVNKTIVCSLSEKVTTRNNHTIAYTTNSGVKYGILKKLVTVQKADSESLHFALINPVLVGPCAALEQIVFPVEIAHFASIISMDFVSVKKQSSRLIAIFTDSIVMKLFNVDVALIPLVNEHEKAV